MTILGDLANNPKTEVKKERRMRKVFIIGKIILQDQVYVLSNFFFLDHPIKTGIGMTGEMSLRGNVLPIGGLKEKSTAALRAGLTHIIVPHENSKDLEEIPELVKKDLKITFVKEVSEVMALIF